jgi:hypothetical protein
MRIAQQTADFLVVDDFLSAEASRYVWHFFHQEPFRAVQADRWVKGFRLVDGQPMWSDVYTSRPTRSDRTGVSIAYPSGKAVDALIEGIIDNLSVFSEYIGQQGTDWHYFFCRPYLYPAGTGLSWHSDGRKDVAGAYVYYAHPEWYAHWGAELLIDGSGFREFNYPKHKMYDGSIERLGAHLDAGCISDAVMKDAAGHYVLPSPNRFVLLRRGVLHRLNPVHASAGDHVRASIAGFFIRDES